MVAEPDSVKLIRILETGTEFVVVLKLGDDSDVWARTFKALNEAQHYADVCASMLNGEDIDYSDPLIDDNDFASDEGNETEMISGQTDADSWDDWDDDPVQADEASATAKPSSTSDEDDSWDDWDDDSEPASNASPKGKEASDAAEADSWDDWDDDSEPAAETPSIANPSSATAEADSWDDWDDDSEPAAKASSTTDSSSAMAEADSWDDWDDDSEPVEKSPTAKVEDDSWDDWDDDSEPEQISKSPSKKKTDSLGKETEKNTVKADIQQSESEGQNSTKGSDGNDTSPKRRRRSANRRAALSFTPVDEDSDAWSPEWGDDSAEDWHDEEH